MYNIDERDLVGSSSTLLAGEKRDLFLRTTRGSSEPFFQFLQPIERLFHLEGTPAPGTPLDE